MYRTITAEFESVEAAELAAKSIKERINNIQAITIKTDKNENQNGIKDNFRNYAYIGGCMPNELSYLAYGVINSYLLNNNDIFYKTVKSSTIEINCKQNDVNYIHNILTSGHALNIKEN